MTTFRLGHLATITLASLLAVACDDDTAGGSQSGGESASSTGQGTNGTTTTMTTTGDSAETDSNSGANSSSSSGPGNEGSSSSSSTDPSGGSDSSSTGEGGSDSSSTGEGGESSSSTGSRITVTDSESESESESESAGEICEAPGDLTPCDEGTDDPFQAIGLGCAGGPNEAIPIFNNIFASADPTAWRVVSQYGTHIDPGDGLPTWRPREGSSMLMISTSNLPEPDADGVLVQAAGEGGPNGNPDNSQLPAPMSPLTGSAAGAGGTPFLGCDGVNDCSDSINEQWNAGGADANDLLWFQFETPVPGGTYGFSFDFAYFSAEFPEWVDTTFNDIFLVWADSEAYTGNLCFVNDEPCTVTALWPPQFEAGDPVLEGTLFEDNGFDEGEATGWFQAQGAAVPGELLQLTFAIFDMGDSSWDTLVLIDNFQWDCEGCTPSEVDPCIGIDPV